MYRMCRFHRYSTNAVLNWIAWMTEYWIEINKRTSHSIASAKCTHLRARMQHSRKNELIGLFVVFFAIRLCFHFSFWFLFLCRRYTLIHGNGKPSEKSYWGGQKQSHIFVFDSIELCVQIEKKIYRPNGERVEEIFVYSLSDQGKCHVVSIDFAKSNRTTTKFETENNENFIRKFCAWETKSEKKYRVTESEEREMSIRTD